MLRQLLFLVPLLLFLHSCHLFLSIHDEVEVELCGNGTLDEGEECDIQTFGGKTCKSEGFDHGELLCSVDCRLITIGCGSNTCGNGVVEGNESCDGTDLGRESCLTQGYTGGTLKCWDSCLFDTSECTSNTIECGNGLREFGEECDGEDVNNTTCSMLGYHTGVVYCNANCTFNLANCTENGRCGDGVLQSEYGEECDGSDLGGVTCTSLGYYGGVVGCTEECTIARGECELHGFCGDGEYNGSESCDGSNFFGATCATYGYTGGSLRCNSDCTTNASNCYGTCGDGRQSYEDCDGSDFGGATCATAGLGVGPYGLHCDWGCGFTGCTQFHLVETGGAHSSCKVGAGGALYCWGDNTFGQLGNGSSTSSTTPTIVHGGHSFVSVSLNGRHVCARTTVGALYCWGMNDNGQLGDNSTANTATPSPVSGNILFSSFSTGCYHTCGIATSGELYCWGDNSRGQLGDSTTINRTTPTPVNFSSGVAQVAHIAGGVIHTCGLTTSGSLYCWGSNQHGQLGNGTTTDSLTPTLVSGNHLFTSVSLGAWHSCGLTTSGALYCWGSNQYGQLGDGTTTDRAVPTLVSGNHSFDQISTGYEHTCGHTGSNTIYCWGANEAGQLGDGTTTQRNTPVLALQYGLSGQQGLYVAVSAGRSRTCGTDIKGGPLCWGRGPLGDGTTTSSATPVPVSYW